MINRAGPSQEVVQRPSRLSPLLDQDGPPNHFPLWIGHHLEDGREALAILSFVDLRCIAAAVTETI